MIKGTAVCNEQGKTMEKDSIQHLLPLESICMAAFFLPSTAKPTFIMLFLCSSLFVSITEIQVFQWNRFLQSKANFHVQYETPDALYIMFHVPFMSFGDDCAPPHGYWQISPQSVCVVHVFFRCVYSVNIYI